MTINKSAAWAAAGIIGGGAIAGVTYAAVSAPATASGNPSPAVNSAAAAATPAPGARPRAHGAGPRAGGAGRLGPRALLGRVEHGELTVRGRVGDVTVDLQRGSVTSVSPTSITLRSLDGYTHSYGVNDKTKVRVGRKLGSISGVHTGDMVLLVATGGDALRIADRA